MTPFLNAIGERMLNRKGLTLAAFTVYLFVSWLMYMYGDPSPGFTLLVMVGGHILGVAIRTWSESRL